MRLTTRQFGLVSHEGSLRLAEVLTMTERWRLVTEHGFQVVSGWRKGRALHVFRRGLPTLDEIQTARKAIQADTSDHLGPLLGPADRIEL